MTVKLVNGTQIAQSIKDDIKRKIAKYSEQPHLAIINASIDPASITYIKAKEKACESVGIKCTVYPFDSHSSSENIIKAITKLNSSDTTGIIVQLPLWEQLDSQLILDSVELNRDVDGLSTANLGRMFNNLPCITPATPKAILKILDTIEIPGKNVVIIGRSNLVGKTLAHMLLKDDYTVTICHSKTKNITEHTLKADILISAVGKRDLVTKDMVKKNAVVIDVGITKHKNKIYGDIHSDVALVASYLTPVPGGVGPVTVASLLENIVELAHN